MVAFRRNALRLFLQYSTDQSMYFSTLRCLFPTILNRYTSGMCINYVHRKGILQSSFRLEVYLDIKVYLLTLFSFGHDNSLIRQQSTELRILA